MSNLVKIKKASGGVSEHLQTTNSQGSGSLNLPEDYSDFANVSSGIYDNRKETDDTHVDNQDPPDGGWGWIVTFCAFLINIVLIGTHNCFGLLYLDLVNEFKEPLSKTGRRTTGSTKWKYHNCLLFCLRFISVSFHYYGVILYNSN